MALRKEKDNKIAIRPQQRRGEITARGPVDLWSEMDRMFDSFRSNFDNLFWPWGTENQMTTMASRRTPPMDIADMGDHYEMRLEMPGIPKEDINVEVTPMTIEVSAHHNKKKDDKDKNWLRKERSTMSFYRALEVSEELKTDAVDAELKDGVLTLYLPKVEPTPEHKPKKIQIK